MSNFASTKSSNSSGNKYRSAFAGKNMNQPFLNQTDASLSTISFEEMNVLFRMDEADSRDRTSAWVKLNKALKKEKLASFAGRYSRSQNLDAPAEQALRAFLADRVDAGKLNRAKDVVVDKQTHEITSVPALIYHPSANQFFLRTVPAKRSQNIFVGNSRERPQAKVRKSKGASAKLSAPA